VSPNREPGLFIENLQIFVLAPKKNTEWEFVMSLGKDFFRAIKHVHPSMNKKLLSSKWNNAVLKGDATSVEQLISEGISPDYPVTESGISPLKALLLILSPSWVKGDFLETARLLVENNAALSKKDHRGLRPADYAMISDKPDVAYYVLESTINHYFNMGEVFRPNYENLFATTLGKEKRGNQAAIILRNHNLFAQWFVEAIDQNESPIVEFLDPKDRDYWTNNLTLHDYQMVQPTDELKAAAKEYEKLRHKFHQQAQDGKKKISKKDLNRSLDRLLYQEYLSVKRLEP
jgi:hypothetical protein